MSNYSDKILVFRAGNLGDALVSVPVIRGIAHEHKNSEIILLCNAPGKESHITTAEILGLTRIFKSFISYDIPGRSSLLRKVVLYFYLIRRLRKEGFSACYYLSQNRAPISSIRRDKFFFRWLCGIKNCKGFVFESYEKRKYTEEPQIHEADRLALNCLGKRLDLEKNNNHLYALEVDDEKKESVISDLAAKYGISVHDKIIAIGLGAKVDSKCWPRDYFAELINKITGYDRSAKVVLVGGNEDKPSADYIKNVCRENTVDLTGRLSISDCAAFLSNVSCYIGNDTGIMHLAAAVGIKCFAIFSARDFRGLWEPLGKDHVVFRRTVDCAGCMVSECVEEKKKCLTSIPPSEVFQSVKSLILSPTNS